MNIWLLIAGLIGCAAVALGAVAAHGISDPHAAAMLQQAALYALIHAAVLVALAGKTGHLVALSKLLFISGILLFSGSIALKYLLDISAAGALAPAGGVLLMLGWLAVATLAFRRE